MLYFSYAPNLNLDHMARLCPGAEPLYPAILENYTLTFRKWANVEREEGLIVHGGVWCVGEENLPELDWYEDYPDLYERRALTVKTSSCGWKGERLKGEEEIACLVYLMREPFEVPLSPPDQEYLEMVRQGCRDWGILSRPLHDALKKVSGV